MSTKAPQRLLFVDTLRGLAVLFMIQLHTSHGWLLPYARHGDYWDATQFFGGLAAPLFLLLAGAGLGLQWSSVATPRAEDTPRALARGAQLIVLGYGLRLQMWIIDGAAYARHITYPGVISLIAGYSLAYLCTWRVARGERCARWQLLTAVAAVGAGLAWAFIFDPRRAEGLIRVDVLQCIGASLMLLSLVGARVERRRSTYYVALTGGVALLTPWMQSWVPGPLPGAIAGYFAQWPAAGPRVVALFPLFPWLGFAAIGVVVGLAWGRAQSAAELESLLVRQVALGAVIALLTNPGWIPLRWIATPEPIAALTRLMYKAALCCAMIGPALALSRAPKPIRAPLALLGRSSLLVYWVHLEFAFGTVSRSLSQRLAISSWATGTIVLTGCMWALAALRNTRHATSIRALLSRPVTG